MGFSISAMKAYNSVQKAGVQYVLDSVINSLLANKERRFIYVEIAFFHRWWLEQADAVKEQVKMLVDDGRLEFILGGWCMNDEAATHYNAIIDQMSLGLTFLNDTFGACARPLVAWQIDPFGHSREQASLFAQMGFDGLFFGRLDFEDKELRAKTLNMEEMWRGSASLAKPEADLFTGVNENGYGPPKGFCFDDFCADQPIMDDPSLEDNNVGDRVNFFVDAARHQAKHFRTNHIMMTMGSDFQYSNANMWYKNLDKLIKYVNAANKNVTVFYSTPSCYLHALNRAKQTWNVKTDDFFPYADSPHAFWTGYFTSRPALKGYVRESNKVFQVCQHFEAFAKFLNKSTVASPRILREAMGVAQHHDAVSGTSKQHVANDYAKRLYHGREACVEVIGESITGKSGLLYSCDYLNISQCNYTQYMNEFVVIAYNPLARPVTKYIRFPVDATTGAEFAVTEMDGGKQLSYQIAPVTDTTKNVRGKKGNADHDLVFMVDLPALGYQEYQVSKHPASGKLFGKASKHPASGRFFTGDVKAAAPDDDITIANEFYKVQFDGGHGLLKNIINMESSVQASIIQNLFWYNASNGNNASAQKSGAYIFRPNSPDLFLCSPNGKAYTRLLPQSGDSLVQEVYQIYDDWATQVFRLYKGKPYLEVEWTIGPIPYKDGLGKEIISRYDTDMLTEGYFYTDANGREVLERKKNYRPTWKLNQSEPIAGNYFPVNSRIYIKNSKTQFTVLTDRSQGGASLENGSLELMLHRRLLADDGKGVGEPLNETGQFGDGLIVRGKHYIILDTVERSARQHRLLAEELYMDQLIAFRNVTSDSKSVQSGSALKSPLPANVHLLTLAKTSSGGLLVRLEHQFEVTDDPEYSKPATVSLKGLLKNFEPTSVEELLLGANARKEDVTRLTWDTKEVSKRDAERMLHFERPPFKPSHASTPLTVDPFEVTLQPMQIRTFLLH